MKITELIRKKFLSFEFDDKLPLAAKKLAAEGLSEAPVTQNNKYIGMFSTSDIARVLVKISVFGKLQTPDLKHARNDPLLMHMHHFTATLVPDSDIISAYLVLLHNNVDMIPVVGKNQSLVGVVMASDLRKKMVQMLSEGGEVPVRKAPEKVDIDTLLTEGNTALDMVLHYVQKKGVVTAEEVSAKFKIPAGEIEEYALCLEKHGLLKTEYNFLGKLTLKKAE
jgi:predicted transcriptional regulator